MDEELQRQIEVIKRIVSKETFNITQLLGFNFKKEIGEPLTDLLKNLISANIPIKVTNSEMLTRQREIEYLKLVQDEDIDIR